jgi:hypothetical protein
MMPANAFKKIARTAAEIPDPKKRREYKAMMHSADFHARIAGELRKSAQTLYRHALDLRYKPRRSSK